jgi:hypothetical protein
MTCPNCSPKRSHQTLEGCMWPHHVTKPIFVYDRDSFEKYKSKEYKLPERCVCGAELTYDEPVCICLVEQGQMNGEMLVEVPIPMKYITLELGEGVDPRSVDVRRLAVPEQLQKTEEELATYELPEGMRRKIEAEEDLKDQALRRALDGVEVSAPEAWKEAGESFGTSMGCLVKQEPCLLCDPEVNRISVRCKHTGEVLQAYGFPGGIIRWSCPCGFYYEKHINELGTLPDEILIDDGCRKRDWP